jgi:hypothetical protein
MNCTSCGANLPQSTAQCPVCGTPTPYNVSSSQFDPTIPASQPGSGNSPQYDPTMFAQPYGGTPPPASTTYGSEAYGNPPPPPPNQYGAPPPQQQNIYGTPSQGGYGAQGGYVAPPQQPGYVPQPPPKRRSRLGLILGIIAVVLIVACAGISYAVYQGVKQASNTVVSSLDATTTSIAATSTSISNPTPTSTNPTPTTPTGGAPSGLSIDSTAASIITNVQMASGVDSNFKPTTLATAFAINKSVYATFTIPKSAPPNGFVITKWYGDGNLAFTSKILTVQSDFVGYFSETYTSAAQGAVEFYWCTQSDCSDAKLADVANFTVTATGIHGTPPLALTFLPMDFNRP